MSTALPQPTTVPRRPLQRRSRLIVGGLAASAAIATGAVLVAGDTDESTAVPAPKPPAAVGTPTQVDLHPNIDQRDAAERYHHGR